jgi:hypothetical protein
MKSAFCLTLGLVITSFFINPCLNYTQTPEPPRPRLEPPSTPKPQIQPEQIILSEEVSALKKALVKIRNLEFKQDIKVGVQSKEELKRRMLKDFDEEKPDEELEKIKKALIKFGLIPPQLELGKFMIELLTEQIGGFYDSKTKELNLVMEPPGGKTPPETIELERNLGISWTKIATIHELTHALQDQHFDLLSLPMDDPDNDDLATAVKSVVEGEACYTMYDYPLSRFGLELALMPDFTKGMESIPLGDSGLIDRAPRYIREGLLFPYTEGLSFIRAVKSEGGWPGVNKLYEDLPASTEQILHPRKWLGPERDFPVKITLPDLTPLIITATWTHLLTNVMGELNVGIIFKEFLPNRRPKRIAAGWDGDQFIVFEQTASIPAPVTESDPDMGSFPKLLAPPTKPLLMIWYTTWDRERDTDEFFESYRQIIDKKYPLAKLKEETETRLVWKDTDGLILMERRNLDVLIIETLPEALLVPLTTLIWSKTQKAEIKKVARTKRETEPRKE